MKLKKNEDRLTVITKKYSHENQLPFLKKTRFLLHQIEPKSTWHGHQQTQTRAIISNLWTSQELRWRFGAAMIRKLWKLFSLKTWPMMNLCLHWIGINWCIISVYNTRTKSKSLHLNGFSFMFIHEIYSSAQPVPKLKKPWKIPKNKNDAKKSKKVTFNFQVMKRLNIIYQEKFKVTRRKTLLKSLSLKQGKNTAKLQ